MSLHLPGILAFGMTPNQFTMTDSDHESSEKGPATLFDVILALKYCSTMSGCAMADCMLALAEQQGTLGLKPIQTLSLKPTNKLSTQSLLGWSRKA